MTRLAKSLVALSVLPLAALAFSGCAAAPTSPAETPGATDPVAAECARMVTDQGGLDDHSFNQATWAGMEEAGDQFGIDVQALVSTAETDLAPNVDQAAQSGCGIVITVGWSLSAATSEAATASPDVHFAIVDDASIDLPNVKPIVFDTAQASFLAGYLAAGVTKTGKVATFGGGNEPAVTLFMDGFADGIAKYNEVHGASVQLLGWDKATQDGAFTGDYEDKNKGKVLTEGFIAQGADIILPVAGQVGEGAAAAAAAVPGTLIIWVDTDGFEAPGLEQYQPIMLTSVMKQMGDAVVSIIGDHLDGAFTNEPYIGTLENGGVDIAPFHDLEATVGPELAAEIDELRAQIIAGDIVVESPSAP
ncbi:MAG: BMP family ABC transporter substrate-binding protein [Microbacteriaceae bacterium]|nr:BMP family ABC transporter substrate-binding protein [Microbacteriaceae bacterium]